MLKARQRASKHVLEGVFRRVFHGFYRKIATDELSRATRGSR